jgi:hypothetical protein
MRVIIAIVVLLTLCSSVQCSRRRQSASYSTARASPSRHRQSMSRASPSRHRHSTSRASSRYRQASARHSTIYYLPKARYVGQTTRDLPTRLREHAKAGKNTQGAHALMTRRAGPRANRAESAAIARFNTYRNGGNKNRGNDVRAYVHTSRSRPRSRVVSALKRHWAVQRSTALTRRAATRGARGRRRRLPLDLTLL